MTYSKWFAPALAFSSTLIVIGCAWGLVETGTLNTLINAWLKTAGYMWLIIGGIILFVIACAIEAARMDGSYFENGP